ncbi:MAG: fibronectin-binding domain-containing protein [Promethearchaeota archaeon]|nr:MAG: fibronectin-binding domain-containing protein [Candidatus Lokiarchaeota archaeon]
MKEYISSFDLAAAISEIKEECIGAIINNVYQIDSIFILKLRTQKKRNLNLLIEPARRFHLTDYKRAKPKFPAKFCMTLRKYLRRKTIIKLEQYKFDRVLVLTAGWKHENTETGEIEYSEKNTLIAELFTRGILTLLNEANKVIIASDYKTMRDRRIIPNREYQYAPVRGINLYDFNSEEIYNLAQDTKKNIINFLAKDLGLGGTYGEEILLRIDIDKNLITNELSLEKIDEICDILNKFIKKIETNQTDPIIYLKNGEQFDIQPFKLISYKEFESVKKDNYNLALDEYFSPQERLEIIEDKIDKKETLISKQERVIESQKQAIENLAENSKKYKKFGDLIYQYMNIIQEIINSFEMARNKGYDWDEIQEQIDQAKKQKKIPSVKYIEKIDPKNGIVYLIFDSELIEIDYTISVHENAEKHYQRSKKSRKKVEGAKNALRKSIEKLETVKREKEIISEHPKKMIKKRTKNWYEKYHWFFSSDGFLVIAGRDLKTNEILFRKYLDNNDLFIHADFRGSPVAIIKADGKEIPKNTIEEAAQFTVIYSSAWDSKYLSADAYWVEPDQVSQSPPSGQYLPKGSFMIRGNKNFVKNLPLKMTISLIEEGKYLIPTTKPISVITEKNSDYILLKPGSQKRSEIAKRIKEIFLHREDNEDKINEIKNIPLDEIIRLIPGKSEIEEK